MAPEYVMHAYLSIKADVYSFGVVVLELISGQKNYNFNLDPECQNLLDWVRSRGVHWFNYSFNYWFSPYDQLGSQFEIFLGATPNRIGFKCEQTGNQIQIRVGLNQILMS